MRLGSLGRAADGSRDVAKEMRSKTAAAPAPNKMHCQVAKVCIGKYFTRLHTPVGEHWFGTVVSCAVQKPTPTPTGTDATRRTFVKLPAQDKNRTTIATPAPNRAHCHSPNVSGGRTGSLDTDRPEGSMETSGVALSKDQNQPPPARTPPEGRAPGCVP